MSKTKTEVVWERAINDAIGESQVDWQKVAERMKNVSQVFEEHNDKLLDMIFKSLEDSVIDSPDLKELIKKYLETADLKKDE